jgi:hypothetical protein
MCDNTHTHTNTHTRTHAHTHLGLCKQVIRDHVGHQRSECRQLIHQGLVLLAEQVRSSQSVIKLSLRTYVHIKSQNDRELVRAMDLKQAATWTHTGEVCKHEIPQLGILHRHAITTKAEKPTPWCSESVPSLTEKPVYICCIHVYIYIYIYIYIHRHRHTCNACQSPCRHCFLGTF